MRTSNKILLGIFLAPLILLATVHVALYAKYKSGHYVSMKTAEEDRFIRQALKNINHVAVYGLNDCRIVPSDSARLEIGKEEKSHLHYTIHGDSLIIHGDSVVARPGAEDVIMRSYQSVDLYLPPAAVNISADNSELRLAGSRDSIQAGSYHFLLTRSSGFKVEEVGPDDSGYVYFKALIIQATRSGNIGLTGHSRVADLQLTLLESEFTDNGASIGKLGLDADKISTITLNGENLKKVNTIH